MVESEQSGILETKNLINKNNPQIAQDIRGTANSIYPQVNRFGGLFTASLETPAQPTLVADKILEVAESESWQLRHPVGPDAMPFIEWRESMTDEEWIDWHAAADDDWYDSVENLFGLNARQKVKKTG